jgi:hypothetical protein
MYLLYISSIVPLFVHLVLLYTSSIQEVGDIFCMESPSLLEASH